MTIAITERNISREGTDQVGAESKILRYTVTGSTNTATTATGNTINGNPVVSNLSDTTHFIEGVPVAGSGIPAGTAVQTIDSTTQITLTQSATATAGGVVMTFTMDDDANASLLVKNSAPAFYLNRPQKSIHITPKGNGVYDVEINYEHRGAEMRFRSSGAGGKVNLKQSLSHAYYPSPSNPGAGTLTLTGNTTAGSNIIPGIPSTVGVFVGQMVSGAGACLATGGNTYAGKVKVDGLSQTNLFPVGAAIFGNGIPFGASVFSIDSPSAISISTPAFADTTGTQLAFLFAMFPYGTSVLSVDSGTQISVSNPANANGTGVTLNFAAVAAIDFKGAINVGEKSEPAGVEIAVPSNTFTVQRSVRSPLGSIYAEMLDTLAGHKNSDVVTLHLEGLDKTYNPGELQFFYAEYGIVGTDDWEVTLYCGYSPNMILPPIGDITGVYKEGWDYFWVSYRKSYSGGVTILVPQQVCIEQVLPSAALQPLFN